MKEKYSRLFEKVNSRVGDDELMKAVLSADSNKKSRSARLKRIPIGAAAALVLAAGGIVTAVAINKASLEARSTSEELFPELDYKLPVGKYYPNGDKNSDIWLEVTEDTIQLKGKNLEKTFREDEELMNGADGEGNTDTESLLKWHMGQFPVSPCKYTVTDLNPNYSYAIRYTPADGHEHAMVCYYNKYTLKDRWGEFLWEDADVMPTVDY